MSDLESIAQLLEQSLNPATSKQAEQSLRSQESTQGFALSLLHVVASSNLSNSSRLAAALFFKNFIKRKWVDEEGNYLIPDTELIKSEIIPLMISLPNNLQIQIGEAISIIADSDFPERWPTLIDDLVNKLSQDDMITNYGVLTVAHSIFKRWRPLFRSDALFLEIQLVLDKFSVPFLNLLKKVDLEIDQNQNNKAQLLILFDVLLLLIKIYYDLNCQDIPAFFEDNLNDGMSIINKYLIYSNDLLKPQDDDDEEIETITKVKTAISELIQLYTTRYEDEFDQLIPQFVQSTWNLLTTTGLQSRYDILVSKLLSFLTSVAKLPKHYEIFNNDTALKEITEKIIIPNLTVRESDEELFEDDPIEYIRRDLEGSDSDTRRRSSIDFLRELKFKNEQLVTEVVLSYINLYLSKYQSSPENWKFKDLTLYLFTALAAKGSVTNSGISSTNLLLDVVQFFTNNIVSDLLNDQIHPILKVDAIKYIFIFRNQLTKEQLLESFPILTKHLHSKEFVEYTYSAITIERILSLRDDSNKKPMFNKSDIEPIVQDLLSNVFRLILQNSSTPEKLAENEFLMKTVMRVLIIAEDTISSYSGDILEQLLSIVSIISKNPSNPKFSHFTFESISVLIKNNYLQNYSKFLEIVLPTLLNILGNDVQEFVPYTFQIFAFLLEVKPNSIPLPETYKQLVQPLLSPSVWEFKGNIPAVTRLLQAIITADSNVFTELTPLLGVFQKLIASKLNENYGFDLLETIILKFDDSKIQSYTKQIAILLLQRLQNSRTEKYVKKLIGLISKLTIIKNNDYAINFIEQVQPGIFGTIYEQFLLPSVLNIGNLLDKKIVIVGLTNLISSPILISGNYSKLLIPTFQILIKIITSESIFNIKGDHEETIDLELEEITSFGSNFSRLSTISSKPFDPLPQINNIDGGKKYFIENLQTLNVESGNNFLNQIKSQLTQDDLKLLNSLAL
ncbi:Exportin-2 [Wickerhamomyces ciferrii]|uniref:Exportin-2 n=1 Tax=Wickerhamomyces ciferrii (strain ATCC 14091 / BCRC 22168 / CBS 111 / JCM 3599 / NBRC 0793 / NRRL Y-1031 F-60-10) TaxID=1206466 RepID=K0KXL7_WICCF|nr:Exportin-2 [Wickerhamomyces ciferrii]CCH46767.1 Exportin-2 [Wickerhamomyces ciferrii]